MLAIRLQRLGRSGHAQYRMIVQDKRNHPKRGRVVAYVGTFNPHTKAVSVDADSVKTFLSNGAQPTQRVARLLKDNGVKLPKWVTLDKQPKRTTRHPEKLRKNRPPEAAAPKAEEPVAEPAKAAESGPAVEPEVTESTAIDPAEAAQAPDDAAAENPKSGN